MSEFGLPIQVLEEGSNTPIAGATVTGTVCALDSADQPIEAVTGSDGKALIAGLYVTIARDGYRDYVHQLYRRPSLAGPVTVHLQRR
jgi:hypothetical protein